MEREGESPIPQDTAPSNSALSTYLKKSARTLLICIAIASVTIYVIKRQFNPHDNFVVIVNNTDEGIGPLSLQLREDGDTHWAVSYDTGVGSGHARAYLIPHAILSETLILRTGAKRYSCEMRPRGRYGNTIFVTLSDDHCTCVVNQLPE